MGARAHAFVCGRDKREREREKKAEKERKCGPTRRLRVPACARVCFQRVHLQAPPPWMRERERNKRGSTKPWPPRRHHRPESANILRRDRNRSSSAVSSITSTIKSNQIKSFTISTSLIRSFFLLLLRLKKSSFFSLAQIKSGTTSICKSIRNDIHKSCGKHFLKRKLPP